MQPNFSIPIDTVIIKDPLAEKASTTLLNSSNAKTQHHLYHYWTLNERLRSKNEKLVKRQQSSCRLAFYCLWLFLLGGILIILIYRFTEECSLLTIDRKQLVLRCFRHLFLLAALSLSLCACTGVVCSVCRYFRSQPKQFLDDDEYKSYLKKTNDVVVTIPPLHAYSYETSNLSSHRISHPSDEHSNTTMSSSLPNASPLRKIPPFTYEEFPSNQKHTHAVLPNGIVTSNPLNPNKSAFFCSSPSDSSSPQSNLSTTIITNNIPRPTAMNCNKHKPPSTYEDPCASTPTSYTTCACGIDIWERQQSSMSRPSPH
ncbi:unnamed protein product [Adineta ricciae]|uniref:Uncharacterized protein n=1 Tax=Adineta ricciae TaxID=249248 RepID=A0A815NC68_ADIRI|nr:unnamed protein product [Adineta ricciae]CAF1470675.1 unnamed protein product [Adineta ricciae]